jgi:hypothetical protein
MNAPLPLVTIIIPTKPDLKEIQAVGAALKLDYPKDRLEIIVARGTQPAVQRNKALREARGELVYFLDDDSIPQPDNLRRVTAWFERPEVQIVGGPNICPPEAPKLEQAFGLVMGGWLAFGPSRARYCAVGKARSSSEKELILCNMIARREPLLKLGGFDEALYPNEENALMDEIQKQGGQMIYDPEFRIERRPRKTFKAFMKMLMTYGRGRAEQFRLHPTPGSALNLAPPLFCVYLPIALVFRGLWLWPLFFYALVVLAQTWLLRTASGNRMARVAPLIVLTHLLYGAGFWKGLFTRLTPPTAERANAVTLERVPVL